MEIAAGDELGLIYGLYRLSRDILGVQPFWFWNDQPFERAAGRPVPQDWRAQSEPMAVRYRGWFINDEALLHAWTLDGRAAGPWEMAFEALLRLGGNMVIPGTDKNAHRYGALAADFGLYVTQHHAEPLGAVMFRRAYPHLKASYAEHPDLFEGLCQAAIEAQKGWRVVWNLGFRGQGDCPFWEDDPRYDTGAARGALISRLIKKQYDMVQRALPGAPCCTNLYGEVMELYRQGFIELPEGVIRIWADNGYGQMVTRRQGNHNPRVRALPEPGCGGRQGLYYHASFYDLQAAAQMTMLPNPPSFVRGALREALALGVRDYWLINCSNIKSHVYTLDYLAEMWRSGDVDPARHLLDYCARYYGAGNAETVAACFQSFYRHTLRYGPHEDERAGEQFGNHCAHARLRVDECAVRARAGHALGDRRAHAARAGALVSGKVRTGRARIRRARPRLRAGRNAARGRGAGAARGQRGPAGPAAGAHLRGLAAGDGQPALRHGGEVWLEAFYEAGRSRAAYLAADRAMREHGKWRLFYANDCQADVKQSAWLMGVLMGALRNHGGGPHFYRWQRRFIDPVEDAGIMLILNMENHLDNDELFARMQAREFETGPRPE